jgi:hypothetical protein
MLHQAAGKLVDDTNKRVAALRHEPFYRQTLWVPTHSFYYCNLA